VKNSSFDSIVYDNEKLLFIIEDTKNNIFGGFIRSKINRYSRILTKNKIKTISIPDENSFIFKLKTTGKTSAPQWTDSGKWTNTTNFNESSLNYTKNNTLFYKKVDVYATYKGKALASKLGRDTNPEFFGVIPLIKI
jgi:hypothetical protein